jgi:hypothetical protein
LLKEEWKNLWKKKKKQDLFQSAVGSLLYLVNHSRPDIVNFVRELSKVLDRAGYNHWKALLSAIKYCEVTKDHVLQIFNTEKQKRVKLEVYCHINYLHVRNGIWEKWFRTLVDYSRYTLNLLH